MRQLALIFALLAPALVFAQASDEAGREGAPKKLEADTSRNYLRLALNFYGQTDGGGNPDVDENMKVAEPQLLLGLGLSEKLTGSLKLQGGIVSAASTNSGAHGATATAAPTTTRRGGEDGEDGEGGAVSGASGNGATKKDDSFVNGDPFFGIEPGLFYAWSDAVGTGVGVTYNKERTYSSIGGNARFVFTTPDKNDTFLVRGSVSFDTVKVRYFDGTGRGSDTRHTFGLGLGWTHILTPKTQMTFNYDLTYQQGLLSTTYNSVRVAGTEVTEVLPDTRLRHALFGRIRHLLLENLAVEPGAGVYIDDWGAKAASFELRASWEFVPGVLILQPAYRFHWQSQVSQFTSRSETSIPAFRTQDSDLDTFTSHTIGLKLVAPKVNLFGASTELEFGGDYTFRSDRLNSFTLTAGFLVRF